MAEELANVSVCVWHTYKCNVIGLDLLLLLLQSIYLVVGHSNHFNQSQSCCCYTCCYCIQNILQFIKFYIMCVCTLYIYIASICVYIYLYSMYIILYKYVVYIMSSLMQPQQKFLALFLILHGNTMRFPASLFVQHFGILLFCLVLFFVFVFLFYQIKYISCLYVVAVLILPLHMFDLIGFSLVFV